MDSKQLQKVLSLVKHGLYANSFLPELGYFTLAGQTISSFNDAILISYTSKAFNFDEHVMVKGDDLIKNIKSFPQDVDVGYADAKLVLKAKKTKIAMDIKEPLKFPNIEPKDNIQIAVGADWVTAVELCLRSVGKNIEHPEEMGVLMECSADEDTGVLYSTDNTSISLAKFAADAEDDHDLFLPVKLCQVVTALSIFIEDDTEIDLVADKHALMLTINLNNKDEIKIVCKLSSTECPNYSKVFNSVYSRRKYSKGACLAISPETVSLVNRHSGEAVSDIAIDADELILNTNFSKHSVSDECEIINDAELEFSNKVEFSYIKRYLDCVEKIVFTEEAVILSSDHFINLVSYV